SNDSINNRIAYADLRQPSHRVRQLLWKNDAQWGFIGNAGGVFYLTTTLGAPNGRVVAIDVRNPGAVRTVVPESRFALQSASYVGGRFILSYLADAHSAVSVFDAGGRHLRDVTLPGLGTATGFSGFASDRATFYSYAGWTTPPTIYRYDVVTGESAVYRQPRIAFDSSRYVTREVFYPSKDGTRVPMMVSFRRGTALDGSNPTILYGYGGFDIPMTPAFSTSIATWLQMGGVYAVANIRGGSEYGEAWH